MRADMHRKCAKYLCETYRHIVIPIFKVQEMVCRSGPRQRRLNSRGARNLLSLGHFKFRQRLLSKARQTRSKVWVVTEEYTSKTCGSCGERYNVTGKNYMCPSCGTEFDRDFNGARNILIKHLSS
jgi:putative transposase